MKDPVILEAETKLRNLRIDLKKKQQQQKPVLLAVVEESESDIGMLGEKLPKIHPQC